MWVRDNDVLGALFNLANGTIVSIEGTATATIASVGDGWYRCTITRVNSNINGRLIVYLDNGTSDSYLGYGTSGVFVWGGQAVEGTNPLTYLPTTTRLNIPRVDYSLVSANLLLEPQRTNLIVSSSQFDGASWSKQNLSVTANTTISPSGIIDADTLLANGTSGIHRTFQLVTFISGTSYTLSIYAKKNTNNFVQIVLSDSVFNSSAGWANFDLNNGTIGTKGDQTNANITDVGNGWYRCSLTATAVASISETVTIVLISSSTAARQEVNTLSTSVYLWGAQLEAGSYPTSYIPTTSATVTRNRDQCIKTGISSLIGQTEGTMFVEMKALVNGGTGRTISLSDGTTQNRITIEDYSSADFIVSRVISTNVQETFMAASPFPQNIYRKIAVKYKLNDCAIFINGVKVAFDTSVNMPISLSDLRFDSVAGADVYNGNLKTLAIYKTALTDAECINLTTL